MSDLKSKFDSVRFVPVQPTPSPAVGFGHILFGVIYPASVVAFELATRMCAKDLFDPMPTLWHVFAVCLVPASNLWTWWTLSRDSDRQARRVAFVNGAAIACAAFYALLFLPLMPVAIIAIPMGLGLLPLAPLSSLISALLLRRSLRRKYSAIPTGRPLAAGLAGGLVLLLASDVPSAATRLGMQWASSPDGSARERGIRLIRTFGDRELLLRLCYDATARPNGLLSAFVLIGEAVTYRTSTGEPISTTAQAREVYYRVTGQAFNAVPAPFVKGRWDRFADFQFDDDHGAAKVGGRVQGLTLASSRIDGSIAADDATAYLEWTFEFRNVAFVDREARVQVALPPGAVVSRATLWVNGEEREAAYGGRAEVRAAYQTVAVQQRRDPLLVTTKGADRVLAQAFPVPRNGGTIRFKLGITAPLDITEGGKGRLVLPAIVDRNFSFAADAVHAVWIEARNPLAVAAEGLSTSDVSPQLHRISGQVSDGELAKRRPAIVADRSNSAKPVLARIGDGQPVIQETIIAQRQPAKAMVIVVDGSARAAIAVNGLIAALEMVPATARVGLIIAAEPAITLTVAAWSKEQKQAAIRLLKAHDFVGGQDNAPAIADALIALEAESEAALLWVHGPQPVSFQGGAARLEQAGSRLSRLPRVSLYATEPGPNELLPDAPWAWEARSLPATGSPTDDLAAYVNAAFATAPKIEVRRRRADTADVAAKGSEHIARLWAANRVSELMRETGKRADAVALASEFRLVTPVSGAVVLETKKQFEDANLHPVAQGTVPTVPEPHEWAMILMAMAAMTWTLWRNRRRIGRAA